MRNYERVSATGSILRKAASIAATRGFPDWISGADFGASASVVMPRVRDNLVLRLVAGRRQERDRNLVHATGTP